MCGIVGLIDNVDGYVSKKLIKTMNDIMISRGPDGDGYYFRGQSWIGDAAIVYY